MRNRLLLGSLASLAVLAGCAHESGYGSGGGFAYLGDCGYDEDCYGGPQYTCVIYQPPAAPARMEILLARQNHSTRIVGPHVGTPLSPSVDSNPGGSSSSVSNSMPPPAPAPVPRAPVVPVSPSTPRTPN